MQPGIHIPTPPLFYITGKVAGLTGYKLDHFFYLWLYAEGIAMQYFFCLEISP